MPKPTVDSAPTAKASNKAAGGAVAGGAKKGGAKPPRNRELARIHVLKAQLKLDDETYRAVLWTVAQVESAADADTHQRQALIRHLDALAGKARVVQGTPPRTLAKRPMLRKIAGLLADAARPWAYAQALAQRICNKQALEFCSDTDLGKIVAALVIDAQRQRKAQG